VAASKAGRFTANSPNLQQLPSSRAPDFKKCIVAAPGHVLVCCDWSQIEIRAAAWIFQDPALTAVYAEGRDLHCETASAIVGIPVAAVTKEQRQAAKPVNFGAIYGIGAPTLAVDAYDLYDIPMTEDEATRALARFFGKYQRFDRWRWDHWRLCQEQGFVRIGCGRGVEAAWETGRRLSFPQCCNLPIQGQAADAMLRAIQLAHRRMSDVAGGLVACVHDELLVEVPEDNAERVRTILEETMTEAFAITFPGAPLTGLVQAAIGKDWLEAKGK
jgi:DNA polymerase I-like protein with 3'-5' exonuclease and polymerase domains